MKRYVKNILIYIAALLGVFAFIGLFSSPLRSYDSIRGTWAVLNVKAYLGEVEDGITVIKGTVAPIFGFIIPMLISIALIIESFQPSWNKKISAINTIFAILYFMSAVLVLLTKELFLNVNNLGDTYQLKNGGGPIFSSICSCIAGCLLLVVTYVPSSKQINFIEK